MATAIYPLNKFALGIESTKGTAVPATRLIQGDFDIREEQDFYRSQYPQGYRGNVGGLGVVLRNEIRGAVTTELTPEEILWPLLTGVRGGVTGVLGTTNDYVWTFDPQLTTGIPTLDTATIERYHSDGSTNHYYAESAYGITSAFSLEWAFNTEAKMTWEMFGRARQSDTPTGSLAIYSTREILVSHLLSVYLDTSAAGLGGTQLTGVVRSAKLDVNTGFTPDYTLDGLADKHFTKHNVGLLTGNLSMVLELDAVGAARFTAYRNNTPGLFIRLKNVGSAIAAGGVETVQVDGAYRFVNPPAIQRDGEQMLVAMECETYVDTTWAKTLLFTITNQLAAVA